MVTTNHGPSTGELGPLYRAIGEEVPIIATSRHQAATARDTPVCAVIHHGIDVPAVSPGRGGGYALFPGRMSSPRRVA